MQRSRPQSQRNILVKPYSSTKKEAFLDKSNYSRGPPAGPTKRPSIYGISDNENVEKLNWFETFRLLLDRYGKQTTVHGLDRVCQRRTGFKERIIWTIGFLLALYLLILFYVRFARRYQRKQFQTTVNETYFPIYRVEFPEVTICNKNRLNWSRFNESKSIFLAPEHRTPKWERLYAQIVSRYDNLTINSMHTLKGLENETLDALNYINFTNVVDMLSWRCDEILSDCKWRLKSFNCCEIFFPRRTMLGQCLSFNSVMTENGRKLKKEMGLKYPWKYGDYGRGSGLTVRVLLNDKSHSPYSFYDKGILFMTTDPEIYTDFLYTPIRANHIAYIAIWGSFSFMDKHGRAASAAVRGCVFEDENDSFTLPGLPLQNENCLYECQQRELLAACNCTSDLFFPPGPYPICQASDMPCMAKNWDRFDYIQEIKEVIENENCHCYYSCESLLLQNYVRIEPKEAKTVLKVNDSFVDLDVHWRQSYIITYKTSLVFSYLDLIVSFGGIASLLLGCSLISVVEILIFLLLDTPRLLIKKHLSNKRLKELQRNSSIKNLINYDSKH